MLFLWTGPRHSSKTTGAAKLVCLAKQHGLRVAGLLAPSVYRDGELVGFDAIDLRSEVRVPLAIRADGPGDAGPFRFLEEGLSFGRCALDTAAVEEADFVIVDEFGPLELASGGWRHAVDTLARAAGWPLLLVVREELADAVRELYADVPCRPVDAAVPESAGLVIQWLKENRAVRGT